MRLGKVPVGELPNKPYETPCRLKHAYMGYESYY